MGRGARRWGAVLGTVLVGSLVGAGGSARGQAHAERGFRIKVDAVAYYLPG